VLDATCFSLESAGTVAEWLREAMKAVGSTGLFVVWNKCDLLTENLAAQQVGLHTASKNANRDVSGGRSLTRPFRDARRSPSTRL
jgi:hypothetical protein